MKLTRRRVFLASILVIIALTLWAIIGTTRLLTVNQARFDQIQDGMSLEQVTEIFGRPPDLNEPFTPQAPHLRLCWWVGAKATAKVTINQESGVNWKFYDDSDGHLHHWYWGIRRRLGW